MSTTYEEIAPDETQEVIDLDECLIGMLDESIAEIIATCVLELHDRGITVEIRELPSMTVFDAPDVIVAITRTVKAKAKVRK